MASAQIPSYKGDRAFTLDKIGVTIHHGADPNETFDVITVQIPAEQSFVVPLHYHPSSTEWMKLLEGEAEGIIGGEKKVLKAGDDWYEIPAGTTYVGFFPPSAAKRCDTVVYGADDMCVFRHSFSKPGGKDGIKVTWLERAGPDPNQKKRFFEDFFGDGKQRGFAGAMTCFYRDGDSFPSLPGGRYTNWIGYGMVYLIGGLGHHLGLVKFGNHYPDGKDKCI